jgi:GNAT superfamily N-acetyltransferase
MAFYRVRRVREVDRAFVEGLLGAQVQAVERLRAGSLPGAVALRGSDPVGLLVCDVADESCEIVLLHLGSERIGLGSALLREARRTARRHRCRRIWVRAPLEDERVLGFYQRNGFRAEPTGAVVAAGTPPGPSGTLVLELILPARAPDTLAL